MVLLMAPTGLIFAEIGDKSNNPPAPVHDFFSARQALTSSQVSFLAGQQDIGNDANFQEFAPAFDYEAKDESRHSSMQAHVLKRYKSKIELLTKSLEAAHIHMNKQAETIVALEEQLLMAKERALPSQPSDKMEQTTEDLPSLAMLLHESEVMRNQLAAKEVDLYQAHNLIKEMKREQSKQELPNEHANAGDFYVQSLQNEIISLKRNLQNTGDSNLPPDSVKIFADLQSDLEITYAAKNELEEQVAALKRNNLIQAVEIKELQDHVNGLEKQIRVGEVARFPPLPGLESIWDSVLEEISREGSTAKQLASLDEELQRAQREIQYLRKNEHRLHQLEVMRQQSEMMLEAAHREIRTLKDAPVSMNTSKQSAGALFAYAIFQNQILIADNFC